MIKDHLGNVRTVLTEEQKQDKYPVASLESSKLSTEENYYSIDPSNIVNTSTDPITGLPTYTNDNGIGNNPSDVSFEAANSQYIYKLNSNSAKTGLGITLKVMAGDRLDIWGKSYYNQNNAGGSSANVAPTVLELLTDFLGANGGIAGATAHSAVSASTLNGISATTGGISTLLSDETTDNSGHTSVPKAYINYIFFDEQFKCIGHGFSGVGSNGTMKDHHSELTNIQAPKNGYVYIYCSNESPVDVYFDNLQVVHTRSPILEETQYYPFGSVITPISSKAVAFGDPGNKMKYNGKEQQNKEFTNGSGLEWMDYGARMYDNQIGRWMVIDPHGERYVGCSPYSYGFDDPIIMVDPSGKDNIVYLYGVDGSVSLKQMKAMAKQATSNFRHNGLKTTAKVYKGKDLDISKIDKTDAVAIIGKTENVYKQVDKMQQEGKDLGVGYNFEKMMEGNGFGDVGTDRGTVPEVSDGKLITISTGALKATAADWGISFEETAAFVINHGAGHDAGLDHSGGSITLDGNSEIIPGNSLMSDGNAINTAVHNGANLYSQFINSINNTMPRMYSSWGGLRSIEYTSPIYRAFIKRFGNNESNAKLSSY